jgi:hypothetical protein
MRIALGFTILISVGGLAALRPIHSERKGL